MKRNLLTLLIIFLSVIYGGNNLSAQDYVAQVGSTKYTDIDKAIEAWEASAPEATTTMTLMADVDLSRPITLKSTAHHILNLGTYTMTAADGEHAIVIKACGLANLYGGDNAPKNALTINADANNIGGIDAGSKSVVYYNYDNGDIDGNTNIGLDRPIIKITGGNYKGSTNTLESSSAGIYMKGKASSNSPNLTITGGIFDCSIGGITKCKMVISGGIFHYAIRSSGDSTSDCQISGGTFNSFGFITTGSGKFWIGDKENVYNVGVYVDENGYLVVGGPVITGYKNNQKFNEDYNCYTETYNWSTTYLQYSSAKENGLYYNSIKKALDNNNTASGEVLVHQGTLDLTAATTKYTYKGTIKLPKEDSEFTVIFKETMKPTFNNDVTTTADITSGKGVTENNTTVNGITTRVYRICSDNPCNHVARIIGNHYASLNEAASKAKDGDVITLMKDTQQEVGLELNKNVTIDFNNFTYTATSALTVAEGKTITLQNGAITSNADYVISTSGNLTIQDMTITGTVEYLGGEMFTDESFNVSAKKDFIGVGTGHTQKWSTISTPIAGVKFSEPEENEGIHDLYRFNEADELWEYYKDDDNSENGVASNTFDELELGRGYLYANTHDIIFKLGEGSLNTSSVEFSLSYTLGNILKGFNMIGNPFTHTISKSNLFISESNLPTSETLADGFYVVGTNGKWTPKTDGKIAPMESVLIQTYAAAKLTIAPSTPNNGSKRAARNENSYLTINVASKTHSDVAYVSFNDGMGLDKINHRNPDNPMLYIPVEGKNYAIAMMDKDVKEVPVYFNANRMAEYTISIEQKNCEFNTMTLVDKLTGIETNMLIEDYTFMARTFDDANRFVIRMSIEDNDDSETENFAYVSNGSIVIEKIEGNANIRIFDIMGRHIMGTNATGNANIPVETMSTGMYIIQMSDDNGVKVQKIIIE